MADKKIITKITDVDRLFRIIMRLDIQAREKIDRSGVQHPGGVVVRPRPQEPKEYEAFIEPGWYKKSVPIGEADMAALERAAERSKVIRNGGASKALRGPKVKQ